MDDECFKKLVDDAIKNMEKDLWKDVWKVNYETNVVPPIYNLPKYNAQTTPMAQSFCDHEWVNIGLLFDKYVCKKCDKDKLY